MKRMENIAIAAAVSAAAGSVAHAGISSYYPSWGFFPFLLAAIIFVGVYIFISWMRESKGNQ